MKGWRKTLKSRCEKNKKRNQFTKRMKTIDGRMACRIEFPLEMDICK
jgi:hypothetical protein